jgi:hypothetical protein
MGFAHRWEPRFVFIPIDIGFCAHRAPASQITMCLPSCRRFDLVLPRTSETHGYSAILEVVDASEEGLMRVFSPAANTLTANYAIGYAQQRPP